MMFQTKDFLRRFLLNPINCRWKHKVNHWSVQKKKKPATEKALEHFDEVYRERYRTQWPLIRKGLLGKQKYVAVVNNYSDASASMKYLQSKGAINMRDICKLEKQNNVEQIEEKKRQQSIEKARRLADADADNPEEIFVHKPTHSLAESMIKAEYDTSRIIDGNNPTAIMYEFIPSTKLKTRDDFIHESDYVDTYNCNAELKQPIVKEYDIHFPEFLNVFCFEEENTSDFQSPRRGSTEVLNYYLMDGGSILPVLALDLKPGCRLLDMCAAPGGKSLVALQTLYPEHVRCNDHTASRAKRIESVMRQYLFDVEDRWITPGKLLITQNDARYLDCEGYNRILVDVPCTTDRHSLREDDNNIFRADRIKERLQLPDLQTELLLAAFKIVEVGGFVVYSTCSLSPIQNEGVVHMALTKLWQETPISMEIRDLSPALKQFRSIFKICDKKHLKYGHLVFPHIAQNYGPTYFCKFRRIK